MHLEEIEKGQRGRGKEGNEKMTANKKERGLSETRNGKLTGREEEKEKDENCTGLCVSFSLVIFPDRFFSLLTKSDNPKGYGKGIEASNLVKTYSIRAAERHSSWTLEKSPRKRDAQIQKC